MRRQLSIIVCVLCFVMASFNGSALIQKNFGTATVKLVDDGAEATCPDIDDYTWNLYGEGDGDPHMEVRIACEFRDDAGAGPVDFSFVFHLDAELWYEDPPVYQGQYCEPCEWTVSDNSANWLNLPTVYYGNISLNITWKEPGFNEMIKFILHVSIENEGPEPDVSDYEFDSWFIKFRY